MQRFQWLREIFQRWFPDTSFMLSERFKDWSPWGQVGLGILCLLPFLLVGWLYRFEMHLVSRTRARLLLTLRLLTLALVLFVIVFDPVLRHTTTVEEPGRVVIAVDRSDSMDVADPQRPDVDKLRLARALKLVTDLCPDDQLDAWIKQYEKNDGKPLVWVGADEFGQDSQKRLEVEKQRRELHDKVCKRVDELTRTQVAERILSDKGVGVLPAIKSKHQVNLLAFAQKFGDVEADQLTKLLRDPPPGGGQGTDLSQPLLRARDFIKSNEDKPLGIILLTDGQQNYEQPLAIGQDPRERTPARQAERLGERGVPVYPVALGVRQAPATLAVVHLKAPPTVYKDVDAGVDGQVLVTGLPKQKIVVELARVGQLPLREVIEHEGKDRVYPVHFQVRLDKVGSQVLAVTAKADPNVPPPAGKLRTDQSSRLTTVNVADDRARVMLIDGEARYDFHYLNMALRRDRTMQVNGVVFDQPRLGRIDEAELKKTGNPALTMPTEADALANFDCIVLGDVSPEQLTATERARLEKFVADAGRTLVIVAGKRFMPLAYTKEDDPLRKLLPITNPRPFETNQGAGIRLTDDGDQAGFLRMEDGVPERSRERWQQLPKHYWGMIGEAKPGATVLATFDDGTPPKAGAGDKDDPARKKALIVRQNYGFGRVLYVGLDSTWRWRKFEADKYHHRFWGQVVRWAASDKPLITGNESIRFGTREPVYEQGNEVDIVVRFSEDVPPLAPDSRPLARVIPKDKAGGLPTEGSEVGLVQLTPNPAQPRVLEGKVRDLPAGEFLVELAIPELDHLMTGPTGPNGQPGKLRAPFTVTPRENTEMLNLTTDWEMLKDLATRSGGTVYTPETVAELADKLKKQVVRREVPEEKKVLHWEWLLVAFLVLVTAEWVGRKTAGLP